MEDLVEAVHLSSEFPVAEDDSDGITVASEFHLDGRSRTSVDSSNESSLQEKVANFIQNGELNMIKGKSHSLNRYTYD